MLSNRADLISGGDALVEVVLPATTSASEVDVDVDGTDVTGAFALRPNGRYLGVVTGLSLGDNVLTARAPGVTGARITITNHPIGGPVFSGEQVQPWLCTTEGNGLGRADDAQCNARRRSTSSSTSPLAGAGFQPYDPANPPRDVATTTTDQGDDGALRHSAGDRHAQPRHLPGRGALRPDEALGAVGAAGGLERQAHYPFGASCGTIHSQSDAQNVQNDRALSRGFMVATSSLNVLGNNCNTTTSAESVMMLKEHIVETYGEIRYTIGRGLLGRLDRPAHGGQHLPRAARRASSRTAASRTTGPRASRSSTAICC